MVKSSRQDFNDPDAVTVLLTGRSTLFNDIVNRMLRSRNLHFDLVVLKPKKERGVSNSTLTFKSAFINDVLHLGESIEEVEVYEDREWHRDAFEDYLKNWRRFKKAVTDEEEIDGIKIQSLELSQQSESIGLKAFKVHFVEMPFIHLDEQIEENLIRTMMEETNAADMVDEDDLYVLEKKVFNLGYQVEQDDFEKLFDTFSPLDRDQSVSVQHEWRPIRQPSVFIHFSAQPYVLNKVGGIGKPVEFEVTHVGSSNKVLALSLKPVASYHEVMDTNRDKVLKPDNHTRYWSKNDIPVLVLATRDGGKPVDANFLDNWKPIPESVEYRRFIARVSLKQEVSIERISKAEAQIRETALQGTNRTDTTKTHSHRSYNPRGRGGIENRGGRLVNVNQGSRANVTRNAFGYSLG